MKQDCPALRVRLLEHDPVPEEIAKSVLFVPVMMAALMVPRVRVSASDPFARVMV